jgi:hypothetical protein
MIPLATQSGRKMSGRVRSPHDDLGAHAERSANVWSSKSSLERLMRTTNMIILRFDAGAIKRHN